MRTTGCVCRFKCRAKIFKIRIRKVQLSIMLRQVTKRAGMTGMGLLILSAIRWGLTRRETRTSIGPRWGSLKEETLTTTQPMEETCTMGMALGATTAAFIRLHTTRAKAFTVWGVGSTAAWGVEWALDLIPLPWGSSSPSRGPSVTPGQARDNHTMSNHRTRMPWM